MGPRSVVSDEQIEELMRLAREAPQGAIAEFGVYQGGCAYGLAIVAREKKVPIYLYDTFSGIPYQGALDRHKVGDFGDTSVDSVKIWIPDATFGVGVFPDSILPMLPLGFVHIDADQEESYRAAFAHFIPLLVDGGIMALDDLHSCKGADAAFEALDLSHVELRTGTYGREYLVKHV